MGGGQGGESRSAVIRRFAAADAGFAAFATRETRFALAHTIMLATPLQAQSRKLQSKAKFRPTKEMMLLNPAGAGTLGEVPDRADFAKGDLGENAWCEER